MNRWKRLWRAVVRWWKNEPPDYVQSARKLLCDYEDSYARRISVIPDHARQAARIVELEGRKRAPTLESEVRILALALERVIAHMEGHHSEEETEGR